MHRPPVVTKPRRRALLRGLALCGALFLVGFSGCFERFGFMPSAGTPFPTPDANGWKDWRDVYFESRDGLRACRSRRFGAAPSRPGRGRPTVPRLLPGSG